MWKQLVDGSENCTLQELTERLNDLVDDGYGECRVCDSENFLQGDIGAEWHDPCLNEPPKDKTTYIVIC